MGPVRVKHLKAMYDEDFNINSEEKEWKNLRSCLRPQSPTDLPIIGQMAHFPNVVVNAGQGGHGSTMCLACAKIVHDIVDEPETRYFDNDVTDPLHPLRYL